MRNEREYYENQLEQSLKNLKYEAATTQRDTNRAIDRLNQLQSEIYLKHKQNELHSHEFYNDIMNQSKIMMASIKYHQPMDQILN